MHRKCDDYSQEWIDISNNQMQWDKGRVVIYASLGRNIEDVV